MSCFTAEIQALHESVIKNGDIKSERVKECILLLYRLDARVSYLEALNEIRVKDEIDLESFYYFNRSHCKKSKNKIEFLLPLCKIGENY